jgi:hypothetical protein
MLVHGLIDSIVDHMQPVLDSFSSRLAALEEFVLEDKPDVLYTKEAHVLQVGGGGGGLAVGWLEGWRVGWWLWWLWRQVVRGGRARGRAACVPRAPGGGGGSGGGAASLHAAQLRAAC